VGYPPGYDRGDRLPLVLSLHGYLGTHGSAFGGYSPRTALTLPGPTLRPMAVASIDGGGGYWHPHPGDDPMGMVLHEFLPMLRRWGLGVAPDEVAVMGISMGGYGAILFAEKYPDLFRVVAAISPAIFVTYAWVHYVNPGAYFSAADFADYDAVTHTAALRHTPVRIASGQHDPFHPWVEELAAALPPGAEVLFPPGAHTGTFFRSQIEPSLRFISEHLHD
jgi:pimeloyl-ACP methyl ester carboxylesterase